MYISINRKTCRFLHKHPDVKTVANLDFIANQHDHTDVMHLSCVDRSFSCMTDMELAQLYRHTARTEPPYIGDSLRALLTELAERYPETDAVPAEAEVQANSVEQHHPKGKHGLVYVKGSSSPGLDSDGMLFPQHGIAISTEEAAAAVRKHLAARAARIAAANAATPAPIPPQAGAPVAQPRTNAPRSGVCKAIWDFLDAEYNRNLSLKVEPAVPTRNCLKSYGATQGWNSSTISVQYTAWFKQRNLQS